MATPRDSDENVEMSMDTLTMHELAEMEMDELEDIFSNADVPSVSELDGKYRGLALASIGHKYLPSVAKKAIALYVGSPLFLWKGKEFEKGESESEGKGKNLLLHLDSPLRLFSFTTHLDASELDGKDCLLVDYDNEKSPLPVRLIRDELRRVNPALYLGRAYVKVRDEYRFINYFCLEPA